ncbi:unnamed protein product [Triticum turgidum subsp. durum]|uniref:KIB1-4 beta-propeller domain-containing protein n=1 Tax=Triticum turgidum subsp. durum TaxID=4567 RepID=A0A9R1BHI1_TRITD|nr:unnamed protein product [Triticum turgidum subsp. durum]
MAGNRRRCRRGRTRPQQAAEPSPPPAPASLSSSREVAVAARPSKKICDASGSISSPSSGSHAWENLLDSLLHQIISLISSFHDLLAFRGTCHSWHAAASSFPSAYTFSFPPLHLKPDVSQESYNSDRKSQLVDPAKKSLSHRCSAPGITPHPMRYLGCSYGYLIFSDRRHCHLVDVYTGTKVKPPKFQSESNTLIYFGILTAPLNSPNSRLILFSRISMLQWQVGTNSWTEHPHVGELIHQIVLFKGQMFAMDFVQRLHTIHIAPELSMQEVAVMWEQSMLVGLHSKPWLVVCGDMLLLVDLSVSMDQLFGFPGTFQVFRLDFSVEPAKWVKMDKLDNWALFLTNDRRNPTLSCMNPERWGGKSNYIYVPTKSEDFDEPWTAIEVGQPVPSSTHRMSFSSAATAHCSPLNSLWVLPSLVYGVDQ